MQVNMLDAKNQLSKLVKAALDGENVVIASNGKPMVKLVPVKSQRMSAVLGKLKIKQSQIDDAFSPETEKMIADMFYGKK
jgi:prevent-host-death family protein